MAAAIAVAITAELLLGTLSSHASGDRFSSFTLSTPPPASLYTECCGSNGCGGAICAQALSYDGGISELPMIADATVFSDDSPCVASTRDSDIFFLRGRL